MATMLRTVSTVIFLILPIFSAVGQPAPASSAQGLHSHVRLLSGGRDGGKWLAGIEIVLDQGFKTYWRTPGESGLPPRFDWSGSENVSSIDIQWPAPVRYEDAAGVAYTYSDKVILPVLVKAAEPEKPIKLSLSADYGICRDICIPAHAELRLDISNQDPDRAIIEGSLAKVPRPQVLGAQANLSVVSVQPLTQDKLGLSVTIRAPAGTQPTLFAEGPEDWYVSTSPPDDTNRFTVSVEEKPKDASGPVPLRLTLVAGGKAIETEVSLDGSGQPR
jgi:DsbC/DsbD-like thiol-disulfide interchange protein